MAKTLAAFTWLWAAAATATKQCGVEAPDRTARNLDGLACEDEDETAALQLRSVNVHDNKIRPSSTGVIVGFPGAFASDSERGLWCSDETDKAKTHQDKGIDRGPTIPRVVPPMSEGSACCPHEVGTRKVDPAHVSKDYRAELEDIIKANVKLPSHCGSVNVKEVKIFTFAIGSLFNKWSVQTTLFKGKFESAWEAHGGCLNQSVMKGIYDESVPVPYWFATATNVSRRWTYPAGMPFGYLAVSLHEDVGESVYGGLQPTSFDDVVLDRPRELNYDYIPLDPQDVSVQWNEGKTTSLREAYHECDALFPFAYGYKQVPATTPAIFEDLEVFREKYSHDSAELEELVARRRASCSVFAGQTAECETTMARNKGFVLVQSYMDVILSGILDADAAGGHAERFVKTTVWPIEELRQGRLYYINDRTCPQLHNPNYVPEELLDSGYLAGTSSLWKHDVHATWRCIDEVLDSVGVLRYRIERAGQRDCASLGMANSTSIPRFTDEFVYGAPHMVDDGQTRMVSPWQRPYV